MGFSTPVAVLLGAILMVSGPTVILPLLKNIRPKPPAGSILRWEGVLIDPIGVIAALLVFEVLRLPQPVCRPFPLKQCFSLLL